MKIGGMFGRSPFGPLKEHFIKVTSCLGTVEDMLNLFTRCEKKELDRLYKRVHTLESEADQIKADIRRSMTHSIFSAIRRTQVMIALKAQDDVADCCLDLIKLLVMRKIEMPEKLQKKLLELSGQVALAQKCFCEVLLDAYGRLEKGLKSKDVTSLSGSFEQTHRQVEIVEETIEQFQRKMLSLEKDMDPVSIILLMRVVDAQLDILSQMGNTVEAVDIMVTA